MDLRYFRHRGHRIDVDIDTATVTYEDGTPYDDEERPCTACGLCATGQRGPDPCLGRLAGVAAACCGHGLVHSAYVAQHGRPILTGADAAAFFVEAGAPIVPLVDDDDPPIGVQLMTRSAAWMAQGARLMSGVSVTEAERSLVRFGEAVRDG